MEVLDAAEGVAEEVMTAGGAAVGGVIELVVMVSAPPGFTEVDVRRGPALVVPKVASVLGAAPEPAPLIPAPPGAEATTPIGARGPEGTEAIGSPESDEAAPVRSVIVVAGALS
jgi:hypothetical protein